MKDWHSRNFETLYNRHNRNQRKKNFISPKKKRFFWGIWFLIGFVLFALVIFLVSSTGFFVFQKSSEPKWDSEKIDLNINGPTEIASGENVAYSIILKNEGNLGINNPEISISFPQGFVLTSAEPKFSQNLSAGGVWSKEIFSTNQKRKLKIEGRLFGKTDEKKVFNLSLSYQPENFSSTFLKTTSYETKITSSLIGLDFDFPEKVIIGQDVSGSIKITKDKTAVENLKNVKVALEYPDGFKLVDSDTETTETEKDNTVIWNLGEVKDEKEIKFTGLVSGENNEKKFLKVEVFSSKNLESDVPSIIESDKIIYLTQPPLELNLTVNGSDAENQNLNWGDNLTYEINCQNGEDIENKNLVLEINFNGDSVLDWSSFEPLAGLNNIDIDEAERGQILVFNEENLSNFIGPNSKGIIKFKINLNAEEKKREENAEFSSIAKVTLGGFKVESNPINFKINTKLNLETQARYFSDDYKQIGSGPLPPLVGKTTVYKIIWKLSNVGNEVKNIKVDTKLPDYVEWRGNKVSANGTLSYNRNTKVVTWLIDTLNAYTNNIQASFDVAITPTHDQIGKVLTLTQAASLVGTDNFTGANLSQQTNLLTTDLAEDPVGSGKGEVSE